MIKKSTCSIIICFVVLVTTSLSLAEVSELDGTLWMYEHESGARHYIAFHENYHYLNSTGFTTEVPDSLWLRSKKPYLFHVNFNGSINYSALHETTGAWALNWGKCNITEEQASFNALGMIYNIFIFNNNKPYILLSTDWHPPQVYTGDSKAEVNPLSETSLPTIFGMN